MPAEDVVNWLSGGYVDRLLVSIEVPEYSNGEDVVAFLPVIGFGGESVVGEPGDESAPHPTIAVLKRTVANERLHIL